MSIDKLNVSSSFKCTVTLASQEEAKDFFRKIFKESRESRYDLLVRNWFYERGFRNLYIARTVDTHEPCNIRWVITSQDIQDTGYQDRYPNLRDDEFMTENVYTLEKFRRMGVQGASLRQVYEMMYKQGFRWDIGYIAEDNIPNLKSNKKLGKLVFERVEERHLLFRVKRKTLERYDPPIPIFIPEGTKGTTGNIT
jgi:hypothetical protein